MISPTPAAAAYAPSYRLLINGQDIPAAVRSCVTSIKFEDGRDASDQVTISLANPGLAFLRSHIRGLSLQLPSGIGVNGVLNVSPGSNLPGAPLPPGLPTPFSVPPGLFDMDSEVRLAIGYYPDPPTEVFVGEITGIAAEFPTEGMPTVTVTAHDFLQRTMRGNASRGFGPLPDAAVAAILSAENGLIPLLDPSMIPLDVINTIGNVLFGTGTKQVHQSDFELLSEIAARYDLEVSVEKHVLYLSRFIHREFAPRMTLTYGRTLLEFAPRVSSVGQAIGMTQRVSLRELRVDLLIKVYWDVDREQIGVVVLPAEAAKVAPALGAPAEESKRQTIRNAIDVANTVVALIAQLRKKLNNRLTGSGTAVGDPEIRSGAMVRLDGLGFDFSDVYKVTKAVHTMDAGGYRTNFEVQREILP